MLPQAFLERMKETLKDEYEAFLSSFDKEKYQALRVNTLKSDKVDLSLFSGTEKVEWAKNGYYYDSNNRPGKHPYHEAGVYYIQEPSAMLPGELIDAKEGEYILDTCSAPGGKSTQMAACMNGQGVLVSNEINPKRAKILSENIERMGIRNAIVTNESTDRLADIFKGFFHRIMVDAPCSGEGMFRKNDDACNEWSEDNVVMCAKRQDMILDNADIMLRPGGIIVYSTCTFATLEDEGSVERFLQRHSNYTLEAEHRLWPHKVKGEGHFAAVLKKDEDTKEESYVVGGFEKGINPKECRECVEFIKEYVKEDILSQGILIRFGDQVYLAPKDTPSLKKLRVLRVGLHLGTMLKNRFEPSHSLALALKPSKVKYAMDFSLKDDEIYNYINGQTFECSGDKGWYMISVDGYSIGWGKLAGGVMKNHYPKGLRKNIRQD